MLRLLGLAFLLLAYLGSRGNWSRVFTAVHEYRTLGASARQAVTYSSTSLLPKADKTITDDYFVVDGEKIDDFFKPISIPGSISVQTDRFRSAKEGEYCFLGLNVKGELDRGKDSVDIGSIEFQSSWETISWFSWACIGLGLAGLFLVFLSSKHEIPERIIWSIMWGGMLTIPVIFAVNILGNIIYGFEPSNGPRHSSTLFVVNTGSKEQVVVVAGKRIVMPSRSWRELKKLRSYVVANVAERPITLDLAQGSSSDWRVFTIGGQHVDLGKRCAEFHR